MNWSPEPFPSSDKHEITKYYEKFESLISKGFIRHAVDEIYVLTSKGIRFAERKENKFVVAYLRRVK